MSLTLAQEREMMRGNLNRVLAEMAEEVKYYVENATPHRQKIKAIAKYEQKRAK